MTEPIELEKVRQWLVEAKLQSVMLTKKIQLAEQWLATEHTKFFYFRKIRIPKTDRKRKKKPCAS
jgi:hypothetical protein